MESVAKEMSNGSFRPAERDPTVGGRCQRDIQRVLAQVSVFTTSVGFGYGFGFSVYGSSWLGALAMVSSYAALAMTRDVASKNFESPEITQNTL